MERGRPRDDRSAFPILTAVSQALPEILLQAAEKRRPLVETGTNAYRLLNGEGDGISGVTVDWFDGVAVASLYAARSEPSGQNLAAALEASVDPLALYVKQRPPEAAKLTEAEKTALAPATPLIGEPVKERIVSENGLRFLIRPAQGLAVGLYLDMRDTRDWVRSHAKGKRVLNCFAYTCGFAVAALAGGAQRAVNIDLSRRSLEWGQENARLNGQSVARGDYLSGDVFPWLERFRRKGQVFDMLIVDPPSFATAKRGAFSAARDWPRLIERASGVISPEGVLIACCNQVSLPENRFEQMVARGLADASRPARLIRRLGPSAIDFPSAPGKTAGLKVLAYEVR
jgi:23S rRNA (cytosine1962-C5)-methyltransferase